MPDLFSDEALKAQLEQLPQIPPNEGSVGLVTENGDVGVHGRINTAIGRSWYVAGEGSWMRRTGYRVAAMLGWRGRSS